ncbi:hypothetical protein TNCV_1789731 [Trichonephila clavipes]|nr:hypothetical protein TNCV_1789731 [Trichonephila clavipes]
MSRNSPFAIYSESTERNRWRSERDSTLTVTPHKSLNSSRGVISEPDLSCASEREILQGLSDQGVTQPPHHPHQLKRVQLFPSESLIVPTIPCESQPPILNYNASTDNSLHTLVPTLPSEDFILPSTSDRVENLSTEIQPPVPLLDTSPTTSSSQPSILKVVNKNSKHRRNCTKEQKSNIEIKMSPHKPNKSYVHCTSKDEDVIVYDVEEEDHFKHIIKTGYLHLITPSRYQKK